MSKQLTIFLSSKMHELKAERDALHELIPTLANAGVDLRIWQFEASDGAPASDKSIRDVYLKALENAGLYIGLFWNKYGEWTIDEFDRAREWGVDRQIYVKDVDTENREPQLTDFLTKHGDVEAGVTAKWFKAVDELKAVCRHSILEWMEERMISRPGGTSAILASNPGDIYEQPKLLIGRDELLDKTTDLLNQQEHVLLQGFGGTGKTALAAEIAATWIKNGKGPVLFLKVGNETAETLFEALARPFNQQPEIAALPVDEKPQAIRKLLLERQIQLVVLDDAWNGKALMQLMKAIPNTLPLIVTSRQWYPTFKFINVGRLERNNALKLLSYYANNDFSNDTAATALCTLMGDNAFALRVAGLTMAVDDITPSELQNRIKLAPHDLKMPLEFANEHEESMRSLLEVSLNSLYLSGKEGKEAHVLFFAFGALFAPTATEELLSLYLSEVIKPAGHTPGPVAAPVQDRLTELERRGLVEKIKATTESIAYYRIHDLSYSYANMKTNEDLREKALNACLSYIEQHIETSPENFKTLLPVMSNFISAADFALESKRYADVDNLALNLFNKSQVVSYLGLDSQLNRLASQAIEAAQELQLPEHEANHFLNLSDVHESVGRLSEALNASQKALHIARTINNKFLEASVLGNMGNTYKKINNYELAENYIQEALAIARQLDDAYTISQLLRSLADLYRHIGYYNDAIQYYLSALEIQQELYEKLAMAGTLAGLGISYTNIGQYDQALECHSQALDIAQELEDKPGQGHQFGNIGQVYSLQGKYQKAIDYNQRALAVYKKIGDRYNEGITLADLGDAYAGLGKSSEALSNLQQALSISRELGTTGLQAHQINSIGNLYAKQNQYAEALEHYNRALEICNEVGEKVLEAICLYNIGSVYFRMNQPESALKSFSEAALKAYQLGDYLRAAENVEQMSACYYKLGEMDMAVEGLYKALDVYIKAKREDRVKRVEDKLQLLSQSLTSKKKKKW